MDAGERLGKEKLAVPGSFLAALKDHPASLAAGARLFEAEGATAATASPPPSPARPPTSTAAAATAGSRACCSTPTAGSPPATTTTCRPTVAKLDDLPLSDLRYLHTLEARPPRREPPLAGTRTP